MTVQNFEKKNQCIRDAFARLKQEHPEQLRCRLNLSWSNWGFGMEALADSAARLQHAGIRFIELHGNHYGLDLGYKPAEAAAILSDHGITVGGVCGMFSCENDLASNRGLARQAALDYLKREIAFAAEMKAGYLLVVPAVVGRPIAYDDSEFERSSETLRRVADLFVQHNIKAAIEPVCAAETSLCHTFAQAKQYIVAVNHPGVRHINGDVYHMQLGESHIATALVDAGEQLVNLHRADSNRCALGDGSLDLDTIIMALYLIGYNRPGRFVTPEPLGPGGDPYRAMFGKTDKAQLDRLVEQTATYFRAREEALLVK